MSAYFLFENLEVFDPHKLEEYKQKVGPVVESFGGRYRVLGGPTTVFEGDRELRYPVIIEFADAESARAWYESDQYRELKTLRQSAVVCNGVLIEGL